MSRVILDYELKRDYQTFLNRPDRPDDDERDAMLGRDRPDRGTFHIEGHSSCFCRDPTFIFTSADNARQGDKPSYPHGQPFSSCRSERHVSPCLIANDLSAKFLRPLASCRNHVGADKQFPYGRGRERAREP